MSNINSQRFSRNSSTSRFPNTSNDSIYTFTKTNSIKTKTVKSLEKKEKQEKNYKKDSRLSNKFTENKTLAIGKVDIKKTFTKTLIVKKPLIKESKIYLFI